MHDTFSDTSFIQTEDIVSFEMVDAGKERELEVQIMHKDNDPLIFIKSITYIVDDLQELFPGTAHDYPVAAVIIKAKLPDIHEGLFFRFEICSLNIERTDNILISIILLVSLFTALSFLDRNHSNDLIQFRTSRQYLLP